MKHFDLDQNNYQPKNNGENKIIIRPSLPRLLFRPSMKNDEDESNSNIKIGT